MNVFTEEDRLEGQRRREARKQWATENLKNDWADESAWKDMARVYGLRLASWYIPASEVKHLNKALKAVKRDRNWWNEQTGFKSHSEMVEANPRMPAWVVQGLILELVTEEDSKNV